MLAERKRNFKFDYEEKYRCLQKLVSNSFKKDPWHRNSNEPRRRNANGQTILRNGWAPRFNLLSHLLATGITTYLSNGGTLENAMRIAAPESARTIKLYDSTSDELTLEEIERIRLKSRGEQDSVMFGKKTDARLQNGEVTSGGIRLKSKTFVNKIV